MTIRFYLLISFLSFSLIACSSTRGLYDAGAAGVGGVVANQLSDGDPLITGAGAAGGVLVSELAQNASANKAASEYKRGYDKGRSDAVKQQYWIVQNQQKAAASATSSRISYVPITIGGSTNSNGTITVPTTQTIRIEE